MLLTITTTQRPATDLSRLLLADPDDVRTCRFTFGEALVFFPQHDSVRCTAAVLVQPASEELPASLSSLAVVLATVFEPAMLRGRRGAAEVEADTPAPCRRFEVQAPAVPGAEAEDRARRLFGPLGYDVELGADGSLWLSTTTDLASLLTHLCVLLPALEGRPLPGGHEAVERVVIGAGAWLTSHPEYALIAQWCLPLSSTDPLMPPRHRGPRPRHCSRHLAN